LEKKKPKPKKTSKKILKIAKKELPKTLNPKLKNKLNSDKLKKELKKPETSLNKDRLIKSPSNKNYKEKMILMLKTPKSMKTLSNNSAKNLMLATRP
jgi:hypothetical protein